MSINEVNMKPIGISGLPELPPINEVIESIYGTSPVLNPVKSGKPQNIDYEKLGISGLAPLKPLNEELAELGLNYSDIYHGKSASTGNSQTSFNNSGGKSWWDSTKEWGSGVIDSVKSFFSALGGKESGGDYQADNHRGYIGKYQLGTEALIEAGYKDRNGKWTGRKGIKSQQAFLNSPEAQEDAMLNFTAAQKRMLKNLGAYNYIGKTVGGIKITESGLLAGAHLGGPKNLMDFLKTNGRDNFRDGNKTPISSYITKFGGYNGINVLN